MLTTVESQYRRVILEFLDNAKSEESVRAIMDLISQGRIEEAVAYTERYTNNFGATTLAAMLLAANTETKIFLAQIPQAVSAGIAFDPTDERAASVIRETSWKFAQDLNRSQRDTIRAVLAQSQLKGLTTEETARAIRNSIGLTPTQHRAIQNYERLLREGSMDALTRDLRDRRSDRSVRSTKPLSEKQIASMVDRYRDRYLQHRATTIARTEGNRAANVARHEALKQMVEKAGIDPAKVRRTWVSHKDHRTRTTHRPHIGLDGQQVGLDEPFVSPSGAALMTPGDSSAPAKETINCRCTTTTQILP